MIINIPLTIDDENIQKKLTEEAEIRVINEVIRDVKTAIAVKGGAKLTKSYYGNYTNESYSTETIVNGLYWIVREEIDKVIAEYKDEIIKAASEELAKRLARTKAAKELIKEENK